MSRENPTLQEIDDQFKEWSHRHFNPSGRPLLNRVGHRLRGGMPLKETPVHLLSLHDVLVAKGLPGIQWIPSPNYSPGRDGHHPQWTAADPNSWIVCHTQVGWMASTISAFQSVARQASAHYLVGLDGRIVAMVHETDAAWTNGTYSNNPGSNLDSVTIEGEDGGDYNGPRTPQFYAAYSALVADISSRNSIPLVHRGGGGGVLRHKECSGAQTACPDALDVDGIIAHAVNPTPIPPPTPPPAVTTVKPTSPVSGTVFDTATNDRSFLDYATVGYIPGQVAPTGAVISWDEAKWVKEPSSGNSKWLDHISGGSWGLWDDCIDDGGFDPLHFLPAPPVPIPIPIPVPVPVPGDTPQVNSFNLSKAIPLVNMATDTNSGKTVGPAFLVTAFVSTNRPVVYFITQYSHDHAEGLGLRQSDVQAALVVPVPPTPVPIPTPTPVDPTKDQNAILALLRSIYELLKKFFGG